jgi:hypothetical protein
MRCLKSLTKIANSCLPGMKQGRRQTRRWLRLETLESRWTMTAEGQSFAIDQTLDISDLAGSLTASVQWGDGTTSAATIQNAPAAGPLRVRIDYSLDSSGFFASADRRALLQTAADLVVSKFTDTLSAIQPAVGDTWTATFRHPGTGEAISRINLPLAANEILLFAGARSLGSADGGLASRGGFSVSSSSSSFITAVQTRGNPGVLANPATDTAPWGGSLAFDTTKQWYFGTNAAGMTAQQLDFLSIAIHEFNHIMGFGTTASFNNKIANSNFIGATSRALYGGDVPLADPDHFLSSIVVDGRRPSMTPDISLGIRQLPTRLDLAALDDIGWQLSPQTVRITANHVYGDNGTFNGILTLNGSKLGSRSIPINAAITNAAPVLQTPANTSALAGQSLSLPKLGQFTDAGFGAPNATPPRSESFVYRIDWGDGSAADTGNATISSLGSATAPTAGFFDAAHTFANTGVYTVTVRVTDDDGGFSQKQFTVQVTVPPRLNLAINRTSFSENAGAAAARLTVERIGTNLAAPFVVQLVSNDPSEATVPASITIPANQTSAGVDIAAVDDTLLDGTVRVQFTANAGSLVSNTVFADVLDAESLTVTLDKSQFSEAAGAGAAVLTVRRSNTDVAAPLTVQLLSSDTTEATLPASVIIPSGASSVTVGVNAVDDALFDGNQTVIFTIANSSYATLISASATVTDHQPIALAAPSTELNEDIPSQQSTSATVSIRSPAPTGGVTIRLAASIPNVISFPASVIIPAGATSVPFTVSAVNDSRPQAPRTVTLNASGTNLIARDLVFTVRDTDPSPWTNPRNPYDIDNSGRMDPLDVLVIINEINRGGGSRFLDPIADAALPFVDPNRDGSLDPLDVLMVINEINRTL